MANFCVNTTTPQFQALYNRALQQNKVTPASFAATVSVLMEQSGNINELPSFARINHALKKKDVPQFDTQNITERFTDKQIQEIGSNLFAVYKLQQGKNAAEKLKHTRDFFALNAYSYKVDGVAVPLGDITVANNLISKELEFYKATRDGADTSTIIGEFRDLLQKSMIVDGEYVPISYTLPTQIEIPIDFADSPNALRQLYLEIYANWNTTPENPDIYNGRTFEQIFKDSIKRFGMRYPKDPNRELESTPEPVTDEGMLENTEDLVLDNEVKERIHDRSHLEENPMNKISGEVKTFLSTIKSTDVGILGLNNHLRFEDVYTDIISLVHTAQRYPELLQMMRNEARFGKEHLNIIADSLQNKGAQFEGKFWSNLALTYNEFFLIRADSFKGKNGLVRTVRLINSNRYTKKRVLLETWKTEIIRHSAENNNNALIVQEVTSDDVIYRLNKEKAVAIRDKEAALYETLRNKKEVALTDSDVESFLDLMQTFGIFTGNKDFKTMMHTYFASGIKSGSLTLTGRDAMMGLLRPRAKGSYQFQTILNEMFDKQGNPKETVSNLVSSFDTIIMNFADIQAKFDTDLYGSFLNGENKSTFPMNMRTALSDAMLSISKGTYFTEDWLKDAYMNPVEGEKGRKFQQLYIRLFGTQQFGISKEASERFKTEDMDVIKQDNSEPITFSDMTEKSILETKFNAFVAGAERFAKIALMTQAERKRMTFVHVPKLSAIKEITVKDIVIGAFIQELADIARNKQIIELAKNNNSIANLYLQYHYKVDKDGNVTYDGNRTKVSGILADVAGINDLDIVKNISPRTFSEFVLDMNTPETQQLLDKIYDNFNEYVDGQVESMEQRVLDLQIFSNFTQDGKRYFNSRKKVTEKTEANESVIFKDAFSNINSNIKKYGTLNSFLRDFYINDLVHKDQLIKTFRVNDGFAKNYEDFSKRVSTLNTPGYKLMTKGDSTADLDYGMAAEVTEATIDDLFVNDSEFYDLIKHFPYAEAYKGDGKTVNMTDAQGFMSIHTYRDYQQGRGFWDMNLDEKAYQNYKKDGKAQFVLPDGKIHKLQIKPLKFYQEQIKLDENGILAMHSIKNSYFVLTKEMTEGNEKLNDLRERMEATGDYKDLNPINLVNTVSTRKLAKTNVFKVTDAPKQFTNIASITLSTDTIRVPQDKPDSDLAPESNFGSQIMRLILPSAEAIKSDTKYTVDGNEVDAKTLYDKYHQLVNRRLELATQDLLNRLNWKESMTSDERRNFLRNIKAEIMANAEGSARELSENQLKSLDIIDTIYGVEYVVSMDFPAYVKEYEKLVFSLFKSNVLKLKTNGKQVVQVAELGKVQTDSRLKMIRPDVEISKPTINVYWGQAESETSTKILSNLAPRKFTWQDIEYGSVEHAYQSNKSGTFDQTTYDAYNRINGFGTKIRGKGTVAEMKAADSLGLMKKLVVESFRQNPEQAKLLLKYEDFTHNTNELIDKAFLDGLRLAKAEIESKTPKVKNGQTLRAEIVVSQDVAKKFGWKEGMLLTDLPAEAIAYRIPTQGKSSMLAFQIVKILPAGYESTVIVPAEITVQMGSDFDIDSLFLMMPNTHFNKKTRTVEKIQYDITKDVSEITSDKLLQNGIYEIMTSILMNPTHLQEILQPLDGGVLDGLIKEYKTGAEGLTRNGWDTEVQLQLRNRDGTSGIAIYANALMGHVTGQHTATELGGYEIYVDGKSILTDNLMNPVNDFSGLSTVLGNIIEYTNAAVDNAKTPKMKALNSNPFTSNVITFMLQTGFPLEYTFLFTNQPVIRQLSEYYENKQYNPYQLEQAINEVFVEKYGPQDPIELTSIEFDTTQLRKDAKAGVSSNLDVDAKLLSNFYNLHKAGADLLKLNKVLTPNRISDMSSMSAVAEFNSIMDYLVDKSIFSFPLKDGDISINGDYTLNDGYLSVIHTAYNFASEMFPYDKQPFSTLKLDAQDGLGKEYLRKLDHDILNSGMYYYMFTLPTSPILSTFTSDKVTTLLFPNENSIVEQFRRIKAEFPKLAEGNPLLNVMSPHSTNTPNSIQRLHFVNAFGNGVENTNRQALGFKELYNHENATVRQFAQNLIDYTILTTGFENSAQSLIKIIPSDYWIESGTADFFKEQIKLMEIDGAEMSLDFDAALESIIQHNVEEKGFLRTVQLEQQSPRLDLESNDSKGLFYKKKWVTYFKSSLYGQETFLYKLSSATDLSATYVQIPIKGSKYNLIEMNIKDEKGNVSGSLLGRDGRVMNSPAKVNQGKSYVDMSIEEVKLYNDSQKKLLREIKTKEQLKSFLVGDKPYRDIRLAKSRNEGYNALSSVDKQLIAKANVQKFVNDYIVLTEQYFANQKESLKGQANILKTVLSTSNTGTKKQRVGFSVAEGTPTQQHLINAFKLAGVDVNVVIDNSIEGFGEVTMKDGKATIRLQEKRALDTEYHEFAHIYVELMSQMDSKLIADGYNQLVNTPLYAEVKNLYPKLTDTEFQNELLVTAIGREAAMLNQLPKWKIWLNRLWYATRKLFGLKDNNVAKTLGLNLVSGKILTNSPLINSITLTAQQKKQEVNIKQNLNDIIVRIEDDIKLLRFQKNSENSVGRKELIIKKLDKALDQKEYYADVAKPLIEYIDEMYHDAGTIAKSLDRLKNTKASQRHTMLSTIGYIGQYLQKNSMIYEIKQAVQQLSEQFGAENTSVYLDKLKTIEGTLAEVQGDYKTIAAPAMAEALTPFVNQDAVDQLNTIIDAIENGTGYAPMRIAEFIRKTTDYTNLVKRKNNRLQENPGQAELINDTFYNEVRDLQIAELRRMLPTQANIEKMLLEGDSYDNMFSTFFDPTIYSHDQSIQLFTLMVKDALEQSREKTMDDRKILDDILKEYIAKTGKSPDNAAKFYGDIIETVKVRQIDKNGNETYVDTLALVQEFDITKFSEAQRELYASLHKKYNVPDKFDDPAAFLDWKETNQEDYTQYRKELGEWYANNSDAKEGWKDEYDRISDEIRQLESKIDNIVAVFNADGQVKIENTEENREFYNLDMRVKQLRDFLADRTVTHNNKTTPIRDWTTPSKEKYSNPKYKELQSKPAELELYNKIKEFYFKKQSEVGTNFYKKKNKWDTHTYFLPSIRKSEADRFIEDGLVEYTTDKVKSSLKVLETDNEHMEYGSFESEVKMIPLYYNSIVPAKEVSNDVMKSMLMMANKANEFVAKGSILGQVNMMDSLLKSRRPVKRDHNGRPTFNNLIRKTFSKIDGDTSQEYQHFKHFVDHIMYGEKHKKFEVNMFGQTIEMNKTVGSVNKLAAFNVFPFNWLQGVANVLHGNILISEEAAAGRFFNWREYKDAKLFYMKHISGIVSDLGKNIPESFLGQLIEYFDGQEGKTIEGLTGSIFGSKLKNLAKTDQLMFIQRSGELQLAITPMLAILKRKKAYDKNGKVIMKDGKEMSLLDAFSMKDGKLTVDPNVKFDRKDKMKVINQVHGVNRSLQGIYDQFNRSAISKYWLGKAFLLFRSWMLANFRRNLGYSGKSLRIDHETGQLTDGILNTLYQFLSKPFTGDGTSKNYMKIYKGLQDFEKQNVKKGAVRAIATIMASLIIMGLQSDEDEDPNNWLENYIIYQNKRLKSELQFWYNPWESQKLLRSPVAGQLIIEKVAKLGNQLITDPTGVYERSVGPKEKGDSKLYWRLIEILPIIHNINKAKYPEESAKFFDKGLF